MSVPSPPRFVPMIRSYSFDVNPDSKRAVGTLLMIWLAPIAMYVSRPVMMLSRKDTNHGTRSIIPMNTKNPINVPSSA